jgi:hypothetical protein
MDPEKAYELAKEVYKELRGKDVTFRRFYDAVIDTPWGEVYIEYKSLNDLKACSKTTIIQALVDKYHAAKKGMVIIWVFESEDHPTAVAIKSFLSGDVITVGSVKREDLADAIARALAAKRGLNAEEIKQALLAGKLKVHGGGGARLAQSLTEEEVGLARRLSDWVKEHWDLIAFAATTTARVAFEEYCKHNPPKSPEEAQLREYVRRALDAADFSLAAYGTFENALAFVKALKDVIAGTGGAAAAGTLLSCLITFNTAIWWYLVTRATYRLEKTLGGHTITFYLALADFGPASSAGAISAVSFNPHLLVHVDGRLAARIDLDLVGQVLQLARPVSVEVDGVKVYCWGDGLGAACRVEVTQRETRTESSATTAHPYRITCSWVAENTYLHTWQVRAVTPFGVYIVGLKEDRPPTSRLVSSRVVRFNGCTFTYIGGFSGSSPSSGSSGSSSSSSASGYSSRAPNHRSRYRPDVDW